MRFTLLFTLLFLFGCKDLFSNSSSKSIDSNVFYKRDITIKHGDKTYSGVAVLPNKLSLTIKIIAAGKLDLFTWTDCHMEHTQEDAGSGGIFSKKNEIEYKYSRDFSGNTYCPVEVGGYESIKGRHSYGFIDFQSPNETMPAILYCNGYVENNKGVSVCQSKKGLLQKIVFERGVMSDYGDKNCPMPISKDGIIFEFPMISGRCVYAFREIENPNRFHRLTTLGYDKILIREVRL